jgi:hypothetical protein
MNKTLKEMWESHTDGRCAKWDHYFEIYERYISKFKGTAPSYLEIGVQEGGSLDLMKEYLGADTKITGIDIDPNSKVAEKYGHNIHIGSQEDPDFLKDVANTCNGFDIIIDDGGHTSNQQIASFITLFPYLRANGVYIVEDLHCSQYWPGWQDSSLGINFLDYAKGLADKLSLWHMNQAWFHGRYSQPREQRSYPGVSFGNFAVNEIYSIAFYDSIIVIEKRNISEPYQTRK